MLLKLVVFIAALTAIEVCLCQQQNARSREQKQVAINQTCGGKDDLARQIEACAQPLLDVLEGTIEQWPKNEKDAEALCEKFAWSESCMRATTRKCAKGLQKTIISTLANSVSRTRKRECAKAKLPTVLKTTKCVERNQDIMRNIIAASNGRLEVINKDMKDLDRKTTAVCCMIHETEATIKTTLTPRCVEETPQILKLYRGLLEDVLDLICRAPKCQDAFAGYKVSKHTAGGGSLISGVLRVMFSLGE